MTGTTSTAPDHLKRAIELDALSDEDMLMRLEDQLNEAGEMVHAAVFHLSRVELSANRIPAWVTKDLRAGLIETMEVVDHLDRAEKSLSNVGYRLRGARGGDTDPSTIPPVERLGRRASKLRRLADEIEAEEGRA